MQSCCGQPAPAPAAPSLLVFTIQSPATFLFLGQECHLVIPALPLSSSAGFVFVFWLWSPAVLQFHAAQEGCPAALTLPSCL